MTEKIGFIFAVLLVFSLPVILFLMLYRHVRKRRYETKSYVKVNAQITSIEKEEYSLPNSNGGENKGVQDVVCYRYHIGGKDWENRHRTLTDDGFGNPFAKKKFRNQLKFWWILKILTGLHSSGDWGKKFLFMAEWSCLACFH